MIDTTAQYETLASNIRYGLSRRGHHDATGLEKILNVPHVEAQKLYSGFMSYDVGHLATLADYFGVNPSDLLDENLTVSPLGAEEHVSVECHDPACDFAGRAHVFPKGMEPALHEIRFHGIEITRNDKPGEKWEAYVTNADDAYTEGELSRLIASATAARALMRDLNRAQAQR